MKHLKDLTDEELALFYIDGNYKAFDLLLSRNQTKIFSYIMYVVHDYDLADDIFQETFVKVITHLQQNKYVNNGKFSAWCTRIAHNVIMDFYREQKAKKIIESGPENDLSNISGRDVMTGNIEGEYVNNQVMLDIRHMINLLPPTQREVVFMRYYQQMSFKEIAEMTNVSINTSLGRMRYAILNLRRMAKDNDMVLQLM
mgnify:CR=1 FL=1